jgi:MerR family redox-sensitive transcriptional activator SoxR
MAGELGIPLADVAKSMKALPEGRVPNKQDWSRLSAGWRQELDRRITLLSRLRDELLGCIGCGCLSMENCPLMNPHDKLAAEGSGPRRLLREGDK